jgi:arginine-tRNA-protein transferase
MHHSPPQSPQFYVTAPQPCPYLDGRVERKLFTSLAGPAARGLNDVLSRQGFRRSQNVVYRPACAACSACMSARIPVASFTPSRSLRRIASRNRDLIRVTTAPWATDEQFELFRRYLTARHAEGGMAGMDEFEYAAMIEETPVRSRVTEYHRQDQEGRRHLAAVCLTDVLTDGLSLVYSFFDPELSRRSLGRYMILDHVQIARDAGLPYVYLGYWVPGSPKMDYKAAFRPLEVYRQNRWVPIQAEDSVPDAPAPSAESAIELPVL